MIVLFKLNSLLLLLRLPFSEISRNYIHGPKGHRWPNCMEGMKVQMTEVSREQDIFMRHLLHRSR